MDTLNSSRMKRRGFSLIELLVVIGLLALLASLTVIGIARLQTHAKQQQTRGTLNNLQAMFAEYDVNRRIPFGAGNLTPSLYSTAILDNIYLPCPGDVSVPNELTNDRFGIAVQITRSLMAQLVAVPNNAAAIGKLPTGSTMIFLGTNPTSVAAWSAGTTYAAVQGVASITTTDPATGLPVTINYVRTSLSLNSSGIIQPDGAQDAPPNPYFWMPYPTIPVGATVVTTPVILDAWGNPIIFVMGGALGARPGSSATSGYLQAGGNQFQVHSPDYHPFFASAGPDGDFSKGDDNLYSYEK